MLLSIDIDAIDSLADGAPFGQVGPYERITGTAHGEIDPDHPANRGIALLAQAPRLFLLDEPLNHLDLHHQIAALELFQRLLREQGTARGSVLVLHDITLAARYADHTILLDIRAGVIAGDRDAVLRADLLGQAFGHPLRRIEHEGRVVFLPD